MWLVLALTFRGYPRLAEKCEVKTPPASPRHSDLQPVLDKLGHSG